MIQRDSPARQRQRLIWLERALIVGLIGVLLVLMFQRFQALDAVVERLSVQRTLSQIELALAVETVRALGAGDRARLAALANADPMAALMVPPVNYLGAWTGSPREVKPGHWYFDPAARLLVYRLRHPDQVDTFIDPPIRLRFRVVLGDADGRAAAGLSGRPWLRPEEAYRWREEQNQESITPP